MEKICLFWPLRHLTSSIVIKILYVDLKTVNNGIKNQNLEFGFIFCKSVTMIQAFYCYIILEEHLP